MLREQKAESEELKIFISIFMEGRENQEAPKIRKQAHEK